MKLEFLKKPMEYLRPVLREVRQVEETGETIIPDSCPDALDVMFSWGTPFVRGKDLGEGVLNISAGVSASGMVQPEGRAAPEVVEFYIPISLKVESGVLHGGQQCRVEAILQRLDAHLVNPRKVMMRASVTILVWVYERELEEHLEEPALPEIQVLPKTAPVRCLKALGERTYTVEDVLPLPDDANTQTICAMNCILRHSDSRLSGNRAVFRGEAEMEILCLDETGHLKVCRGMISFSQYIDLGFDGTEEGELRLISGLAGADVSADTGGLHVTLQITTTGEVWGREEVRYIGDIYSLRGQVAPESIHRSYDSLVDRQSFNPAVHEILDRDLGQPVFVTCRAGTVSQERQGEQVSFKIPVTVQAVYETGDGVIHGGTTRMELQASTAASPECRFEITVDALGAAEGTGTDLKVSCELGIHTFSTMDIQEIVGGELNQEKQPEDGPGVIIRRPRTGETMWDLAKEYRTTACCIAAVNGLDGDVLPDRMLLIPKQG